MTLKNLQILIVEDEAPKRHHIVAAIKSLDDSVQTTEAAAVADALSLLKNTSYDLVILDMSLPTFTVDEIESGGRPQAFGGLEILQTMTLEGTDIPVIVITGFEAFERSGETIELNKLRIELEKEYSGILHAVIHFNSVLDEWKLELEKHLSTIFRKDNT